MGRIFFSYAGPRALPVLALACVALSSTFAGCAFGGGRRADSGPGVGFDAGPRVSFDSGPLLQIDAGPPIQGTDAGGGVDAGPPTGTDAGPPPTPDAGPPIPDAGPPPPMCSESPCRLAPAQCGCPTGQSCHLDAANARTCSVRGPEREGEACTNPSDCAAGLQCIGTPGHCARYCNSDADCSGTGSICGITLSDGSGGSLPGVTLCTVSCDPLSGSGCPASQGCAVFRETTGAMRGFTGCRPAGFGLQYDPCTSEADCQTGHVCIDIGFGRECTPLCRDSFDCGLLDLCNAFSPSLTVGATEYGYCG